MSGIFSPHFQLEKTTRMDDLYAICGRRTYLVGAQDSSFPDTGHHVPGEMGGLWSHPIKVLDGFWLGFVVDGETKWLPKAEKFWHSPVVSGFEHAVPEIGEVRTEVFIPSHAEGMLVTYNIKHALEDKAPKKVQVVFLARTELRGAWLSEKLGWDDGQDEARFVPEKGLVFARDSQNPWFAVLGSATHKVNGCELGDIWGPEKTAGQGISVQFTFDVELDENGCGELTLAVASSAESEEQALEAWQFLVENRDKLRQEKIDFYNELISASQLEIPDKDLQDTFDWIKVNYEMLTRDVPGYGFGLAAGLPTYPWWFGCDNSYALLGALPLGMFELSKETLKLVARYSQETNGNGRIIHEVVTNGVVFNPGNTQETAHFTMAVYETWRWTGDDEFLKELYPICRQGVMEWLLKEMDEDGDLFPTGYGIMEVAGLNAELVDTAIYTQQALACLAKMADYLGDSETAGEAEKLAAQALRNFEERFWLKEEGLYADVQATPEQLLERVDQMRSQPGNMDERMAAVLEEYESVSQEADDKTKEQPWLFKNWVIFCPMEVGAAPKERAERALERMYTPEFTTEEGLYLNGYNQSHKMTISTSVAAVAQARYGFMDRALDYINQMVRIRDLRFPGAPSEMMPDYGCVVQAWTGYGMVYPVVCQFLGFDPDAPNKRFSVRPHLPADWENVALQKLHVGDAQADLKVVRHGERVEIEIEIDKAGWRADVELPEEWLGWADPVYYVNNSQESAVDGRLQVSLEPNRTYKITILPEAASEAASSRA